MARKGARSRATPKPDQAPQVGTVGDSAPHSHENVSKDVPITAEPELLPSHTGAGSDPAPPTGRPIPPAQLREALDRCRWLVAELQHADWSLCLGRGDFAEYVSRIEAAWTAWHQHEQTHLAVRAELLEAMDLTAALLARGKDLSTSSRAAEYAFALFTNHCGSQLSREDRAEAKRQMEALLPAWHQKRGRHQPGRGPWELYSDLVRTVTGIGVDAESLRQEAIRERRRRYRLSPRRA